MIAEDLALLRDGLSRLLRDNGFDVVAAVEDGDALISTVLDESPDVAIVDIRLPPSFRDEGVRAALTLRDRAPGTGILIVSQYVEQAYASELLQDGRGGLGYRGTALDPEVVAQLLGRQRQGSHLDDLSPRELEVLTLMAEGCSNAAIAERLVLTTGAIEKHIANILIKLRLPPSTDGHRRVLAVLAYLQG